MKKQRFLQQDRFITRYSRNAERVFFFYATLAMLILWGFMRMFGD
jgi:hypothetical protein